MIIYGNNLHEKLQGLAISKDYLKYNTPFCDLVDNPDWELDINLALNYNSAINGNLDSATKLVQDLTLNSSVLDGSTIEYYLLKITHNPIFGSAIQEMRARWSTPNLFSDDFQSLFEKALLDCLNSPCNLFARTSDSVARIAQVASNKNNSNTFGVGQLSESFGNMTNSIDETIRTKIPLVFSKAYTEIIQTSTQAFKSVQKVLAGEENLSEIDNKINSGKSLRNPASVFRYTPDVQSYYDYSAASSNVLAKVRQEMGGCFRRFEQSFRYNPYSPRDNKKRSIGTRVGSVNGISTDENPIGQTKRYKDNNSLLDSQTRIKGENVNTYVDGETKISDIIEHKPNGNPRYTIFAAYIDKEHKIAFIDTYDKTPDDLKTIGGVGNIGENYIYAPSKIARTDAGREALRTGVLNDPDGNETGTAAQLVTSGWDHELTESSMEQLKPQTEKIYNDGVAVSAGLLAAFFGRDTAGSTSKKRKQFIRDTSIAKYQRANQAFVAVRPAGTSDWLYFKIIDVNSQSDIITDFTLGAWQYLLRSPANESFNNKSMSMDNSKKISDTGWSEIPKISQEEITNILEIKVCIGELDKIKNILNNGISKEANGNVIDSLEYPDSEVIIENTTLPPLN